MTKQTPILFQTEMVRAINNGTKKQTLRLKGLKVINENPNDWEPVYNDMDGNKMWFKDIAATPFIEFHHKSTGEIIDVKLPYGEETDYLWVRETFEPNSCVGSILYKANYTEEELKKDEFTNIINNGFKGVFSWKPSIHMPKKYCRLWLETMDVSLHRLKDITEPQAVNEGVEYIPSSDRYKNYFTTSISTSFVTAKKSFYSLWEKINGKKSLKNNPWVFAYGFKVTQKPE